VAGHGVRWLGFDEFHRRANVGLVDLLEFVALIFGENENVALRADVHLDSRGRTIWIANAHRGDGKRYVVRADEKLTAFIELERAI
jgi:hypothetical protein